MAFHPSQEEAIHHVDGPMMVLAGPGSGKTTVITHRTKYLIEEKGIDPARILVVTFTRAAAGQMQERFAALMEGRQARVSFGTFHSVFFTILKYAYRYQAADIAKEEQRIRYIREMVERQDLEIEDAGEFVAAVLSEISFVKSEMLSLDHYYPRNCPQEMFRSLYEGYEERMRRAGLLDFDDMLAMCHELLSQREDILKAWQDQFRYILIDEFQDINRTQYEIMRMLARPGDNLFIVGDDDQSVYRFRGAKPEIMLGFVNDYPQAKTVLLVMNYRSTGEIVDAACALIGCNRKRYEKKLTAARKAGKPVVTSMSKDPREETLRIAREVQDYARAGYRLEDVAVLYRTNSNPRFLVERLMEYNIPFTMKDSMPNLYEHWICRDVLAYLRAAGGDLRRSNILAVINRPNRYISRDALEEAEVSWDKVKSFYQDREWMEERVERLEHDLRMLKDMPPAAAVNYIRKAVGYDGYLKECARLRKIREEELLETADQLGESAAGFKTVEDWLCHMEEYKKKWKEQAGIRREAARGVSLMTMHSSKGLEFKVVYILDANEGITPHRRAVLDADIEEERRMFYVAMTRAKERLHVCYVDERHGKKQERSRFVDEYLERRVQTSPGK